MSTTETVEYPIAPSQFAAALREQRALQLRGGLYHLNQVLMAYNTNRIEGSSLDEDQTRYIYETQTVSGAAVSIDDVVETSNSFRLFDAMLDRCDEEITSETLKEYHHILKTGTRQSCTDWFAVGGWKRVSNVVGSRRTTAGAAGLTSRLRRGDSTPVTHMFPSHHKVPAVVLYWIGPLTVAGLISLVWPLSYMMWPSQPRRNPITGGRPQE